MLRKGSATPASGMKLGEIVGQGFEPGKAQLSDEGRIQVDVLARMLNQHPDLRVSVDGHADASGGEPYNQSLSERRARAVADQMIAKGVAPSRLSVRGFGESRPLVDNASPEGRARNRRVEVVVQ